MMGRIGLVAKREFLATVATKGFLIGVFIMPVFMIGLFMLIPRILASRTPQVQAQVAVLDQAGGLVPSLSTALEPGRIAARRAAARRQVQNAALGAGAGASASGSASGSASASARASAAASAVPVGPPVPTFAVTDRSAMPLADARNWVGEPVQRNQPRALVVIKADAVRPPAGSEFGSYDLYVSPGLDENTENVLHESLRLTLVAARFSAAGLDPETIEATMRVNRPGAIIVGAGGEKLAQRGFNRILPFVMGVLLFIGVMTGGQTLMTSTIEEKSNRVVEVLLAAVSPLELMWGKLIGQLGVGLVVLSIYIGMGVLGLFQFALIGLLDPMLVVWLLLFFLVTYLVFGALMMSIGAAVNQMADAQSLLGPVMLLLLAPYMLTPIIGQAPNSVFSVAVSFIPPVNTFAMLARLATVTPPPVWQVLLSLLVGIAAAAGAVWFAAKVFRIGLLMHGKPPNIATLIRWVRQA